MKEQYDQQEGYCPMLGHFLEFQYCRTMKEGLPCGRILNCWFEKFPVEQFVLDHYSEDEQRKIMEPPKAKVNTLVELIEEAQKRKKENG